MSAEHPRMPYPSDAASIDFWEGCKKHELRITKCEACGRHHFYSRVLCPYCHSDRVVPAVSSGRGVLNSYTVIHRAPNEYFKQFVPYVVGLVELEEGPRMTTWVVGTDPDRVRVGMPLKVEFFDAGDGIVLHQFRAASPVEATSAQAAKRGSA